MAGSKGSRGGQGSAALMVVNPTAQSQPQQAANLTDEQKISNALGTQGAAATIDEALDRVNPNYNSGKEWRTNCQRCVWAAEMQRRGYDVEALPRTSDNTYAKADKSFQNSFLNVAKGGLDLDTIGSPWWKQSASDIKSHFTDKYDVGNRGMIVVAGSKSGHVFNWEIIRGKNGNQVRFYDTQPHGLNDKSYKQSNVSATAITKHWFYFREARMDNVDVTPLISDFVKPRSK